MKCPYTKPTITDCNKCPFPDCIRSESADVQARVKEWKKANPEKVREYHRRRRENFTKEKKQAELQRLNEWKAKNPSNVKKSQRKSNEKWRAAHREEERERNRLNYLKRKAERVS